MQVDNNSRVNTPSSGVYPHIFNRRPRKWARFFTRLESCWYGNNNVATALNLSWCRLNARTRRGDGAFHSIDR